MKAQDLVNVLLAAIHEHGRDVEVRIGHPVEGPSLHQAVGEVRSVPKDGGGLLRIVVCADEADLWHAESESLELPVVWRPPPPSIRD